MSNQDALEQALDSVMEYEYLENKQDIVEYYQDKFAGGRGKNGWKQHIVNDLANLTGMKPKNLEKRFDPQRLSNPEKRNAAQYAELGRNLPPVGKNPPESFCVKVYGKMNPSPKRRSKGEQPRIREFSACFSGVAAWEFAGDPSVGGIFEEYGIDGELADLLEDGASFEVSTSSL